MTSHLDCSVCGIVTITRVLIASNELQHNLQRRHLHPEPIQIHISHELTPETQSQKLMTTILTAAYFSTRGRNTGSSRRALSDGSCISPSFSPLRSSLFQTTTPWFNNTETAKGC